ncbi:MAG: ABC transporter substrate-binding protein [Limnochordia bacterium]|jgi:ABC-type glycerol-3-phosphate transport system substrate-binding protein
MDCWRRFLVSKVSVACSLLLVFILGLGAPVLASEQITVFLWKAWTGAQHGTVGEWLEVVKDEAESNFPNLKVHYHYVDWGADPLVISIAGGVAPDASIASIAYAFDLYDQGVLMSLTEYWNRSSLVKYEFFPSAQIYNQFRGDIFGVPWSMEAHTIVYNAEMMEQAGLNSSPTALGSWDELVAAARKMYRADGSRVTVAGFTTGLNLPMFAAWLYANGGQFYNNQFNGVAFNNQQGLETLTFLGDLLNLHRLGGLGGLPAFHAGQVGMLTNQIPAGALLHGATFRVGQTDFPPGPSGKRRSTVGWSNMYVIPEAAKNPDLAWAWIETMVSIPMQAALTEIHEPMSPYRQAFGSSTAREVFRQRPYIANTPDILAAAGPYPYIRYDETSRVANPLLTQVANGTMAPTAALDEISRLMDQILIDVGRPK